MTGVDLTESLVRSKQLTDLTSLLDEKVYGEETTLGDKLVPGLLENYTTKPYGDGKVYTLPAFYSPTGLWYDASRFNENGTDGKYKLPTTWEEFWALGDELNDAIAVSYTHLYRQRRIKVPKRDDNAGWNANRPRIPTESDIKASA